MDKIDFVIPWVDGSDPHWREDKNYHWKKNNTDAFIDGNNESRFRDWDNLRYWFRGVEKFTPWVNNIYFVTYGHVPEWLNVDHPKIKVIKHEDYIPKKYLPVFQANPIEINFHRIPGLSEKFVYFNDDMFVINHMTQHDFFVEDRPREMAVLYPITNTENNDSFSHMLLSMTGLINSTFSKKQCIKNNFFKWFAPCYGKSLLNNILMYRYNNISGLLATHVPSSLKKSTMEEVWRYYEERLWEVTSHKFRDPSDITQYIFRYWTIMKGDFEPTNIYKYSKEFFLQDGNEDELLSAIKNQRYKMICINDTESLKNFECTKKSVISAFDSILSDKSKFEL